MSTDVMLPSPAQLIALGPYRHDHRIAIRATVSVIVPLLTLYVTGHIEWSLFAAFGAFTSLYGRTSALPARLRMQGAAGASLVVSVVGGVLIGISPHRSWIVIPAVAVWATAIAVISHRWRWHPPGPLFQVFAVGACSSVPGHAATLGIAAAGSAGTALFAVAVTALSSLVGRAGSAVRPRTPPPTPAPAGGGAGPQAVDTWRLRHYVLRYALSVLIAGGAATGMGIGHPYWAMVAAVVPMAATATAGRILRAAHRLVGTLLGVGVAWLLLSAHLSQLATIAVAAVAQAGAEMFAGRNYGIALLFVTPLALCTVQLAHPLPVTALVTDRAVETLLGVGVALLITLLTHERRRDE